MYASLNRTVRRVIPILASEFAYFAREIFKFTIIAAVFMFGVWFMTAGLPRLAASINGY